MPRAAARLMGKTLRVVPAVLIAFAVVACGGSDEGAPDPMRGSGDRAEGPMTDQPNGVKLDAAGRPIGPDGKPLAEKLDGKYELSNHFDLTSAGIFPDAANDTLKALSNFKEKPTQTFVDLLDAANVPIVPTVLNAIPSFIRDQVLGFIDDHVFKSLYQNVPVAKTLTSMLDDLASTTTKFELVTLLDLPQGDATGNIQASHSFTGIAYDWQDKRTVIGAPEVVKSLTVQSVAANAVSLERKGQAKHFSPDRGAAGLVRRGRSGCRAS